MNKKGCQKDLYYYLDHNQSVKYESIDRTEMQVSDSFSADDVKRLVKKLKKEGFVLLRPDFSNNDTFVNFKRRQIVQVEFLRISYLLDGIGGGNPRFRAVLIEFEGEE